MQKVYISAEIAEIYSRIGSSKNRQKPQILDDLIRGSFTFFVKLIQRFLSFCLKSVELIWQKEETSANTLF